MPGYQETELGPVCDLMASFAMQELQSAGLKKAFGQDIPESYDGGGFPQMMFYPAMSGGTVTPRTEGRTRAGFGQWTEVDGIEGLMVLGPRQDGLSVLMQALYYWQRKVFAAFWKHQELASSDPTVGAAIQELRPVGWKYKAALPWGTGKYFCIIFEWDATIIVTSVTAGR